MSQAYASSFTVRSLPTDRPPTRAIGTLPRPRRTVSLLSSFCFALTTAAVAHATPAQNAAPTVPPTYGAWIGDPPGAHAPVGINLSGVSDWSTEWVFVDLMKASRPWLPQLATSNSPWNTGAHLALTADGWPILAAGQAAATVMMVDAKGQYPGGTYVCLWEGQGKIELGLNAVPTLVQANRIEAQVTPTNAGILLRIVESNPSNPVRNVRFIMPGFEQTYQKEPFHPLFLQRLAHYQCLRFMDWQETNNSPVQHWADRTKVTSARQTGPKGVAPEYIVALGNRLGKDVWVCMPHLATNDYVRQFATLVRDTLHPSLNVYVEYSNEVWNGMFTQAQYAQQQGTAAGLGSNSFQSQMRWYSQRSVQMFDIWVEVFGGPNSANAKRVKRTLAGQSSNPWTGQTIMDWNQAYAKSDCYAIAPYFGGHLGDASQATQTAAMSVQQILNNCMTQITGSLANQMAQNANDAKSRGLKLVAYEGGQHLVGVGSAVNNDSLTAKFHAANRDPQMYWVYRQYLAEWKKVGGGAFVAFNSVMTPTKWGSWGALEYQTQPVSQAHKFRALADFIAEEQAISQTGTTCGPIIGSVGTADFGGPPMILAVGNALPGAPGVLIASSKPMNAMDLTGAGAWGCTLLVSPDVIIPIKANGQGSAVVPMSAPAAMIGKNFNFQFAFASPGANGMGLTFSNALHAVVQP